jgi:hypothetical protein
MQTKNFINFKDIFDNASKKYTNEPEYFGLFVYIDPKASDFTSYNIKINYDNINQFMTCNDIKIDKYKADKNNDGLTFIEFKCHFLGKVLNNFKYDTTKIKLEVGVGCDFNYLKYVNINNDTILLPYMSVYTHMVIRITFLNEPVDFEIDLHNWICNVNMQNKLKEINRLYSSGIYYFEHTAHIL